MLDLGCGTGQLAFRFSDWFEKIMGIDTEPEMIQEAIRLEKEYRLENLEWFNGDLESFKKKFNNHLFDVSPLLRHFIGWIEKGLLICCMK